MGLSTYAVDDAKIGTDEESILVLFMHGRQITELMRKMELGFAS